MAIVNSYVQLKKWWKRFPETWDEVIPAQRRWKSWRSPLVLMDFTKQNLRFIELIHQQWEFDGFRPRSGV